MRGAIRCCVKAGAYLTMYAYHHAPFSGRTIWDNISGNGLLVTISKFIFWYLFNSLEWVWRSIKQGLSHLAYS